MNAGAQGLSEMAGGTCQETGTGVDETGGTLVDETETGGTLVDETGGTLVDETGETLVRGGRGCRPWVALHARARRQGRRGVARGERSGA